MLGQKEWRIFDEFRPLHKLNFVHELIPFLCLIQTRKNFFQRSFFEWCGTLRVEPSPSIGS
ncbi:unnamed protein product [Spirodela intermedia]|uniref:Uncharacterized protein n=1 Tax=Spirodela intermedia TaxID=51605 RepID=A0A7I8IFC3_SPIIN|nr:unnamed protein product [Spirodela intermedia]CAA6656496.1 unnamed protein product [Spirodela intermedia]